MRACLSRGIRVRQGARGVHQLGVRAGLLLKEYHYQAEQRGSCRKKRLENPKAAPGRRHAGKVCLGLCFPFPSTQCFSASGTSRGQTADPRPGSGSTAKVQSFPGWGPPYLCEGWVLDQSMVSRSPVQPFLDCCRDVHCMAVILENCW